MRETVAVPLSDVDCVALEETDADAESVPALETVEFAETDGDVVVDAVDETLTVPDTVRVAALDTVTFASVDETVAVVDDVGEREAQVAVGVHAAHAAHR